MNSGTAKKQLTIPLVLHRPDVDSQDLSAYQVNLAPFDFEAAYVASLPRLRVTEAHRRIESIRDRLSAIRDRRAPQEQAV